jgi:hypothetical protein
MMSKITAALKSGVFWSGFAAGAVFALGFRRLIPAPVKEAVAKIPGAQA